MRLTATRNLNANLGAESLIDSLKAANELMVAAVREACTKEGGDGMAQSYADFVSEWIQKDEIDHSLVRTVTTSYIFRV